MEWKTYSNSILILKHLADQDLRDIVQTLYSTAPVPDDTIKKFEIIHEVIQRLNTSRIPNNSMFDSISQTLKDINKLYTDLQNPMMDFTNGKAGLSRDITIIEAALTQFALPIIYSSSLVDSTESHTLSDFKSKLNTQLIDASTMIDSALNEMKETQIEAEKVLASTKEVAALTGASSNHSIFADQSKDYNVSARYWFSALIGMVLLIVVLAIVSFNYSKNLTTAEVINFSVSKVIVLTACFYLLTIIIKNYKVSRHNAIVNRHRANALKSFLALSSAATDPDVKQTILLEAAKTIFHPQHTGFGGSDNEGDNPSNIMQIFKGGGSSPLN